MAGRVAVAAVLLLCLGGAHGNTPAEDCAQLHEEVVVSEGRKVTICNETISSERKVLRTVYLQPGGDFKGVSLEVTQAKETSSVAWFNISNCYNVDKWIKVTVDVESKFDGNTITLQFNLNIGGYRRECIRSTTLYFIRGLSIVGHGSSKWTNTHDEADGTCLGPGRFSNQQTPPTCDSPPITTTTTTTTTPTTTTATADSSVVIAVPIAVAVAVILAIAVVCVTYRRRRRGQGEGQVLRVGGEVKVDDNYIDVEPPTAPTVPQPVAPRLGLAASWRVGGEVEVNDNHMKPPPAPTVFPRVAPRQEEPEYLYFGDDEEHIYDEFPEPPIYDEIPEAPLYVNVGEHRQCHADENSDSDDGNYLTPRRARLGKSSGVTEA